MPRPVKPRRICFKPNCTYFAPKGIKNSDIEFVTLKLEELEAMRLKDIEKYNQEECAKKMKVSRQTFQLIIDAAREKVVKALIEGKAINIQGGNYEFNLCEYKCEKCGNDYEQPFEEKTKTCPNCQSNHFSCSNTHNSCESCCRKNK